MQTATLRPDVRLAAADPIATGPVSTPEKFRPGRCHLELTPVWQYVIKKNRFPADVDRHDVFAELAVRLQHPEWQVRGARGAGQIALGLGDGGAGTNACLGRGTARTPGPSPRNFKLSTSRTNVGALLVSSEFLHRGRGKGRIQKGTARGTWSEWGSGKVFDGFFHLSKYNAMSM